MKEPCAQGVLWYFHTYVGSGHFFGFKILNFDIFGISEKWIFFGYEVCGYFWGSSQIGLYLGVISMHFRVFSKVQGTEWRIFWGVAKISNVGLLEIPDIFFWWTVDAGPRVYVWRKNESTPPPGALCDETSNTLQILFSNRWCSERLKCDL